MNPKFLFPLAAFVAIAILLGVGLTMNPRAIPSTKINKAAPDFTLPLLSEPQQSFSPSELIGQRWVLNVWASWCVSCRVEHPSLNQLAKSGANIVGLNYKDEVGKARQWLVERGNPYIKSPVDAEGLVGIDWGVIAVPETFVIDEKGVVIFKHTGPVNEQMVQNDILPLLSSNDATSGDSKMPIEQQNQ